MTFGQIQKGSRCCNHGFVRISNLKRFTVVLQNGVEDRNLEAGIDAEQQNLEHSCAALGLVLAALDSLRSIPGVVSSKQISLFVYRFHVEACPLDLIRLYTNNRHSTYTKRYAITMGAEPVPLSPDRVTLNC